MIEEKDESFEIISEKEKLLRDALVSVESDYIKTEVNGALMHKPHQIL